MERMQKYEEIPHPDNRNEDAVAGSSTSSVESSPKIFNMNVDCFDEIFEYLEMTDLHSFGQTCKRMNKVAGEYFKQNYPFSVMNYSFCEPFGIPGFNQFRPKISIIRYEMPYVQFHISEFKLTNNIEFWYFNINNETIEFFKSLLPQLETVHIEECTIDGDLYELMLKYGENLKRVYANGNKRANYRGHRHDWLLNKYPKLEHLELITADINQSYRINELSKFFVLNPNIQRFSTTSLVLWDNKDFFLNYNAKLDILEVKGVRLRPGMLIDLFNLLNRLYEQGFFKRLYFYTNNISKYPIDLSDLLPSVKGLELLCIRSFDMSDNLPQLTNLKELIILNLSNATDFVILANGLEELERLYITSASIDHIVPFIRRSKKLNKIKLLHLKEGGVLNLRMLNDERAKLAGARKIIIYTSDDIFVATKWATRNGDTNLSLLEMRRSYSYEWRHHYERRI
ncbi:uncharacterized protein LOC116341132 [Contarinia nasturtii]|uniref:uncharacterized protein LOC116341132 n=1 Tax=Contarinia nasturtii TaxID=265458 RepID=UPI0012D4B536|nr:uncharacterized protein LOC116341132 [Contarinia nasturtii]XP_031623886.1 uncharacterized protein LOC116341132 [Contarinia nasturtii]